ncbi:MAG: HesA/MoeB/ThiF family protein [Bacteroidetes bacterium]|nr:HesA/MoeB/ThiF family protein [Bacteroidota bacterium]
MLSNEEIKRYNRHIIMSEIGFEGQEKLKNAKVLMVGAGGLGCPILQYLTAAGVGTIGIIDDDIISESNLQRQILYNTSDVGKSKVVVASAKLSKINSHCNIIAHPIRLTKENILTLFSNYDIIIDGSDNFPTRYLINDACVILGKPIVSGAIYKFMGQVSVFNYNGGPTYRCLFPDPPKEDEMPNCSTTGVLGVIPGIIGTLQANEVIKIILGIGKTLSGRLLQMDTLTFNFDIIDVERDSEQSNITKLCEYNDVCNLVATDEINSISPEELKNKLQLKEDLIIYDVRTLDQFKNYNIGGRVIETEVLLFKPENIPTDKMVVIVCDFGERSGVVVEYLQHKLNMQNVFNLSGGLQTWIEQGYELYHETDK